MTTKTNDTERWEGDRPDRTGWTATDAGVLGALVMTSCCILPLILVSLGVTGVFVGQLTALKRVETVEIAEFVEGVAEDGVYVLHYDDAVIEPDQLIAAVTGVGYGATLAQEDGS